MKGLSVEPGERSALREIHLPGAGRVEIADAADMGAHFAGRIVDGEDRRRNAAADAPARARAPALSSAACRSREMVVRITAPSGAALARRSATCAASIGNGLAAARRRPRVGAASAWSALMTPSPARRASTRSRARARRFGRAIGPARFRRLRQGHEQRRLGGRKPLAAPCRNRRAKRRACLRDCRHRARAPDRGRGSRPCSAAARSAMARIISASLAPNVRSGRGSSRRATCMVSVEPPETTRPLVDACHAARSSAQGSTPRCS